MDFIHVRIAVFLFTFCLSLIFTRFCISIAHKTDFLDHPRGRKSHAKPIPLLGGVSIYLSLLMTVYVPVICFYFFGDFIINAFPSIEDFINGALSRINQLNIIFAVGLGILITGLIDDKKGMNPYLKLFIQITAGSIMYFSGIKITLFVNSEIFSFAATTFWFVLLINSFNLLDNMDGLSAGIGLIVIIIIFFISHLFGNYLVSGLCAAAAGALLGFLIFNFYPARIFMGDAGALLLGYIIGVIMVLTTYHKSADYPRYISSLVPLIVLMVPLYDTFSVVVVRLLKGQSIMVGDLNHFSHRLSRLGMGVKYAVIFLYFITFTTGISAIFLFWVNLTGAILVLVQVACLFGIIVILEYYASSDKNNNDAEMLK